MQLLPQGNQVVLRNRHSGADIFVLKTKDEQTNITIQVATFSF